MNVEFCGPEFCDKYALVIDQACHHLDKPPDSPILFSDNNRTCYCLCGVYVGAANDTQVTVRDWAQTPITAIVQGQTKVLAAGRNLVFLEHVVARKMVSNVSAAKNIARITYLLGGVVRGLIVPPTRTILLNDRRLCPAGKLQLSDRLTDQNRASIPITALSTGTFTGELTDIATATTRPDPNLNGHLLLFNGVVVGDFMTDRIEFGLLGDSDLAPDIAARPWIGSDAWRRLPGRTAMLESDAQAVEVAGGVFTPVSAHAVTIPPWASD